MNHLQLQQAALPDLSVSQISRLPKDQLAHFSNAVQQLNDWTVESQVQTQNKDAEQNYGSDLLNLVVAKGYLTKLLANDAVKSYIQRHEPEILEQFELVVNTVSMEEAVQQQAEISPADVSEASEP